MAPRLLKFLGAQTPMQTDLRLQRFQLQEEKPRPLQVDFSWRSIQYNLCFHLQYMWHTIVFFVHILPNCKISSIPIVDSNHFSGERVLLGHCRKAYINDRWLEKSTKDDFPIKSYLKTRDDDEMR